jgi:hypothetical protein
MFDVAAIRVVPELTEHVGVQDLPSPGGELATA